MNSKNLSRSRGRQILTAAEKCRVLVVGDVMLDQFIWGGVTRISPEAPVPVVDFASESFMPGGAANVARNLVALETPAELFGAIGADDAARKLLKLLAEQNIGCAGLVKTRLRHTSIKTRIVAHQQQVVRIDRETRGPLDSGGTDRLLEAFKARLSKADAVIVGDYGKWCCCCHVDDDEVEGGGGSACFLGILKFFSLSVLDSDSDSGQRQLCHRQRV